MSSNEHTKMDDLLDFYIRQVKVLDHGGRPLLYYRLINPEIELLDHLCI